MAYDAVVDNLTVMKELRIADPTVKIDVPGDTTTNIWVSPTGNDSGAGAIVAPFLTLAQALSVVTATRKTIILMPGRYTSAASLAWPVGVTDVLITGITSDYESTEIHASAGAQVMAIVPNATIGAENFLAFFANLTISADGGINGVQVTNTAMTSGKKVIVTFRDCGFSNDTDTDKSLITTHTDVDSKIKIYMHGRGMGGNNIEGLVYIDMKNAGDRFKVNGMHFEGGVEFSTTAIGSETEFYACCMKLGGGAGGGAGQLINANGCISRDGMTQAAAVQGDFDDGSTSTFASLSLA